MSHNRQTALTTITTNAKSQRDGMLRDLNPQQRDSVVDIVSGGQQLLDMVDEILTYVRSASDQASLVRTEFSITEVVDQVKMLNQPLAAKKRLTLERLNGDGIPPVY